MLLKEVEKMEHNIPPELQKVTTYGRGELNKDGKVV